MEWTKDVLGEFIELYRLRPCLWKQNLQEYTNKNLKNSAYGELVTFLHKNGMPNATTKTVKDKIQNLRRAVRKEKYKVDASEKSGAGTEDVYVPTLWYYDLLAFANDNDPVASIDNLLDNLLSPESSEDNENRQEPDNDIEDSQSNENSQQGLAKSPEIQTQVETPNPEVSVWIVNLTMPKYLFPFELKPTNSVEAGSYITSAIFHGENNVAVIWLNRLQNVYVIVTCRSQNSYNCTDFHIEKEHIGWTEPIFHPVFNENGTKVLVRLPVKDGDNGHYMHVCEIFNNKVRPLTHGSFELIRILAWDEENQHIYAIGTIENAPGVRHLIRITDRNFSPEWFCMTCRPEIDLNMTQSESMNETMINNSLWLDYPCDFNNVIFSKSYKYFIQECLGPEIPIVLLVKTSTNARRVVLDTSFKLRRKVRKLSPPQVKTISVEIEFGYKAQVRLYLPGVLREYEDVTFPLILLIDAAPSSQSVSSKWELSWPWYLTNTRNYVVAKIDARGSGFQGVKMRREIQRRIGLIEVTDQLAVLTYLRDTFKFIDRTKICTSGNGYGGFVSAMILLQDMHQVVNCSISISPITNFRYYNTFFAEKYLGFPSKHLQEYDNADLTLKAANLNGRNLLLIHGTADTQITPQHSLMLAKALIEQDIIFQQLEYPDEDHDFSSKALLHMYKEIDQFFNDSFGPIIDEWNDDSSSFFI